ncbi:MAG: hypothetical protein LBC85_08315, partial [Fibromonadaceae bacterium]|nr:hypothetical protein [Fibromonadaceae bacterium]
MATMTAIKTQAYRTTCVPMAGDRFDSIVPSEYMGREVEIIILPLTVDDQPKYNADTLAAMQE